MLKSSDMGGGEQLGLEVLARERAALLAPERRRRGLSVEFDDSDRLVADLYGTTPASIRELLRRAALLAAEESTMVHCASGSPPR